jgi:hypothetical protein
MYINIYINSSFHGFFPLNPPFPWEKIPDFATAEGPALPPEYSVSSPAHQKDMLRIFRTNISMDWFKGKSAGNHGFYHQVFGFPVNFPIIQFYEYNQYIWMNIWIWMNCNNCVWVINISGSGMIWMNFVWIIYLSRI